MSNAGRPAQHASQADKQKAYRLREKRRGLPLSPSQCTSKEQYVRWHEVAAADESERRNETPQAGEERRARAMRYAAWRWDGVLAGEVAEL